MVETTPAELISKNAEILVRANAIAAAIWASFSEITVPENHQPIIDYAIQSCEDVMSGCTVLLEDIGGLSEQEIEVVAALVKKEGQSRQYWEQQLTA